MSSEDAVIDEFETVSLEIVLSSLVLLVLAPKSSETVHRRRKYRVDCHFENILHYVRN